MGLVINEFLSNFIVNESLSILISRIIAISLIIVIGILIKSTLSKIIKSILQIKKDDKQTVTVARLINSVLSFFVWFIIITLVFSELNINIAPLLASAGVLGFAVGFGAQEVIKDFLSGIFLIMEKTMFVGDTVEIDGFRGTVISIKLRTTNVQSWTGQVKTVNNGSIRKIINHSKQNSLAIVNFSVDYKTNFVELNELMPEFLKHIHKKNDNIVEEPTFSGVTSLADSGINLMLIAKTSPNTHFGVERMIRQELLSFLNDNNIEIPYPHLVVQNK